MAERLQPRRPEIVAQNRTKLTLLTPLTCAPYLGVWPRARPLCCFLGLYRKYTSVGVSEGSVASSPGGPKMGIFPQKKLEFTPRFWGKFALGA